MNFFEKLKLLDVLRLTRNGLSAFYGTKSLGARFAECAMACVGRSADASKIDFGNVEAATGIRRNAYKTAEACIDRLPGKYWADALSPDLEIDFWLIVQKFFFDELYIKFEFIEMALRYAEEHPDEAHAITVDKEYLGAYADVLKRHFAVRYARNTSVLGASTLLLLPLFIEFFWRRKGEAGELAYNNHIICEVDGEKTLEMFSTLFRTVPKDKLAFVVEQRNAVGFSEKHGIGVLGLRREGLRYLRRVVWTYIGCSLRHRREVAAFGSRLFRIFYVLMQGRAEVVEGSGNVYCTYEHLVTVKAVRNEFLKSSGNKTVFVPMNAHVTPQYFHSEILVNYDVICAAGQHTETLYRRKRALTQMFLSTGSYDSHRGVVGQEDKEERIARLKAFKGDALAITIISPGICDPTYRHEVKLMRLARTLSNMPSLRVFVRLKPVPPMPKYVHFHEDQTMGCEGVLLTGGEYELFDFFGITDLFVTSISNAAFDLAQAGAQVMFIDYLRDPELHLCLSAIPGVRLTEEESLATIMSWIENHQQRAEWANKMKQFAGHIAYWFPDFESYRQNFLKQINSADSGLGLAVPVAEQT